MIPLEVVIKLAAGFVILILCWLLVRAAFRRRAYRAQCRACPFSYCSEDLEKVKTAAIFHNLQSREKGDGHQVLVEEKDRLPYNVRKD